MYKFNEIKYLLNIMEVINFFFFWDNPKTISQFFSLDLNAGNTSNNPEKIDVFI